MISIKFKIASLDNLREKNYIKIGKKSMSLNENHRYISVKIIDDRDVL